MKMLLKLVVLLSATVLTLAAPTVMESNSETTSNVEDAADLKQTIKESTSIIEDKDQKESSSVESPVLKDKPLDKVDNENIATKVIDEGTVTNSKSLVDSMMVSEVYKSKVSDQTPTVHVVEGSTNEMANAMLKNYDSANYIKKITEETDQKLKDVASAVAEVVTSLPIPRPDGPSKFTEVIGHFISELLQIPMVLLHAVSDAVSRLTNNKINIPQPGQTTLAPH